MIKANITNAKLLGAKQFGWASFKHNLMKELNIPKSQFDQWNVPEDWKEAFCRANGRSLFKTKG
jgi:hypothetical protein